MDFSKLDQNEKLAVYGSVAVVLAGLISTYGGLMWLAILAAIGMLVVVFLPQISAGTTLPGSKGTLMATLGLVALAAGVITLLQWIGVIGALFGSFTTIMLLVATIGTAVMAWAGWQELQREGGQWRFGAGTTPRGSSASAASATRTAPPSETALPPTATTAAPPPDSPPADVEAVPPPASSFDSSDDPEADRPRDA
jgi:hypothetical protein